MANQESTLRAILYGATRKGRTPGGCPIWVLHTSEGDLTTRGGGGIAYEVGNRTGGPCSWVGKRVTFDLTGRGTVEGWELTPPNCRNCGRPILWFSNSAGAEWRDAVNETDADCPAGGSHETDSE